MKFILTFYKTALHIAVEKENIDIVRLLLAQSNIYIDQRFILIFYLM